MTLDVYAIPLSYMYITLNVYHKIPTFADNKPDQKKKEKRKVGQPQAGQFVRISSTLVNRLPL